MPENSISINHSALEDGKMESTLTLQVTPKLPEIKEEVVEHIEKPIISNTPNPPKYIEESQRIPQEPKILPKISKNKKKEKYISAFEDVQPR